MKKLHIKGPIISNNDQWIYDLFEWDATSPKKVEKELQGQDNEDLEVFINSGGGSVFDASEIYTMLKEHKSRTTIKIVGLAASAASVIAMAGDTLLMAPTAQLMIHNANALAGGDYREMDHMSDILKNVNETIANAYKLKSGKNIEELLNLMDQETWFTPDQALEIGLIDQILFDDKKEPLNIVASNEIGLLPTTVINKFKNKKVTDLFLNSNDIKAAQQAKLKLLNLKGLY